MTEAKILVVDDEKEIADLIELYLTNEAYEVHKFYNGTDALAWLKEETPDLAVLDVMLPDTKYNTAAKEEYQDCITISGLVINRRDHTCTLDEKPLALTPTEFSILWSLCKNRGEVVSSDRLFYDVWGEKYYSSNNNTIMVHIRHLREKMHDSSEKPRYIKTVWGVGYKIE